jgi:hypothetical protein
MLKSGLLRFAGSVKSLASFLVMMAVVGKRGGKVTRLSSRLFER